MGGGGQNCIFDFPAFNEKTENDTVGYTVEESKLLATTDRVAGVLLADVMGRPPLLLGRINVLILQVASHLLNSF